MEQPATVKVTAYITAVRGGVRKLLVFEEEGYEHLGLQVPGGTVLEGESLERADPPSINAHYRRGRLVLAFPVLRRRPSYKPLEHFREIAGRFEPGHPRNVGNGERSRR